MAQLKKYEELVDSIPMPEDDREVLRKLLVKLGGEETAPASLTDNSGGTTDNTIEAVSGSGADTAINNNFAELAEEVNQIRTILISRNLAS